MAFIYLVFLFLKFILKSTEEEQRNSGNYGIAIGTITEGWGNA